MSPPAGPLGTIGQVAIRVIDVERATTFYRDVLGLPFLFAFPGLAFFRAGEVRLMLTAASEPRFDHPASIVYYRVGDIEEAHVTLLERGAVFERAPAITHRAPGQELWLAFLQDGEGNVLALMEERRVP
ncbi:MAG: VOC family protein [Gemmatimonadales bacterium]|nr:VOC family protein [Gemmatimonadales bacterium]